MLLAGGSRGLAIPADFANSLTVRPARTPIESARLSPSSTGRGRNRRLCARLWTSGDPSTVARPLGRPAGLRYRFSPTCPQKRSPMVRTA